jgi:TolB-like protein/DNA-binding winged helix-turn-helix (wHTH) protein/Tfp pilus assembly protein PilF
MAGPLHPEPLTVAAAPRLRFGVFEMDLRTGELRKLGTLVKLQQQPFRVLALLVRRAGDLVTREEIRDEIWGAETYVDFDQGLNFCIKQVRAALNDQAVTPRYIETLPRRGYRFIAPVAQAAGPWPPPDAGATTHVEEPARTKAARRRLPAWLAAGALLVLALTLAVVVGRDRGPIPVVNAARAKLAVLPFENLGSDPEQAWFSDGLTEEMIAQLGRLQPERLAVIARTSVMRYRDPQRDIAAVGRELGVDYVIEGSVRHADGRVRITAKLIDTRDQTQIWTETYERDLQDMLSLQNEVARDVAAGIKITLTPQTEARLALTPRLDPEAYELYLKGRFYWNKRDTAGLRRAVDYFEKVLERRPDYALAHVGIADAYIVLGDQGSLPSAEAQLKARTAALRSLELDPGLAEAQTSLAMVRTAYDWDWDAAENGFRRAIQLNPSYATAHHWYAHLLRALGRFEQAVAEIRRAQELDPLALIINSNLGSALFYAGRYQEAADQYRKTLRRDAGWEPAHWGLGRTLLKLGRPDEAIAELEQAVSESQRSPGYLCALANALGLTGRPSEARLLLAEIESRARSEYVSPYDLALVHAGLGDTERAFAALERAFRERQSSMRQLRIDERLAPLRSDARFDALARRVGLYPWPRPAPP